MAPRHDVENMFPDEIQALITPKHVESTSSAIRHSGNYAPAPELPVVDHGKISLEKVAGTLVTPDDISSLGAETTQPIDGELIASLELRPRVMKEVGKTAVAPEAPDKLNAIYAKNPMDAYPAPKPLSKGKRNAFVVGGAAAIALAVVGGIAIFKPSHTSAENVATTPPQATSSPFPSQQQGNILPGATNTEIPGVANGDATAHAAGQPTGTPKAAETPTSTPDTFGNAPEAPATTPENLSDSPVPNGNIDLADMKALGDPTGVALDNVGLGTGDRLAGISSVLLEGSKNPDGTINNLQSTADSVLDELAMLMSMDPKNPSFNDILDRFTDSQSVKDYILQSNQQIRVDKDHLGQIAIFDTKTEPVTFGYDGTTDSKGLKFIGIKSGTLYAQQAANDPKNDKLEWQDPKLHIPQGADTLQIRFTVAPGVSSDGTVQGKVQTLDFKRVLPTN